VTPWIAAIDGGLLLQVVWVSLAAGIAVTLLFSLVVLFAARSAEHRRGGRSGSAAVQATAAVVSFAVFGALVVYGVHIMLTKS
jgi:hypothetical protein